MVQRKKKEDPEEYSRQRAVARCLTISPKMPGKNVTYDGLALTPRGGILSKGRCMTSGVFFVDPRGWSTLLLGGLCQSSLL